MTNVLVISAILFFLIARALTHHTLQQLQKQPPGSDTFASSHATAQTTSHTSPPHHKLLCNFCAVAKFPSVIINNGKIRNILCLRPALNMTVNMQWVALLKFSGTTITKKYIYTITKHNNNKSGVINCNSY